MDLVRCCSARIDAVLRPAVKIPSPRRLRQRAIDRAVAFVRERLNGEDGLGAIFPGDGQFGDDVRRAWRSGQCGHCARLDREAAGRWPSTRPIASLASRRCGTPRSPATPCWRRRQRGRQRGRPRARLAGAAARCSTSSATGRCADPTCGRAAGPSNMPIRITPISTTPPSWSMAMDRARRDGAGTRYDAAIARARRMGEGPAKQQWRLGGLRRRQCLSTTSTTSPSPITAPCSIRRPRTSPRAAVSMLAQLGETPTQRSAGPRHRLSAPHADAGRQLVRPLGHELHLRHLVGAVRAQRLRARSASPEIAQGGRLAGIDPERRRRLGRGRRRATSSTIAAMSRPRAPPRRPPGRCSV